MFVPPTVLESWHCLLCFLSLQSLQIQTDMDWKLNICLLMITAESMSSWLSTPILSHLWVFLSLFSTSAQKAENFEFWWRFADTQFLYVWDGCNHSSPPQFDTQSNQIILWCTCGFVSVLSVNTGSTVSGRIGWLCSKWPSAGERSVSSLQHLSGPFHSRQRWLQNGRGKKCTVQAHESIMSVKK